MIERSVTWLRDNVPGVDRRAAQDDTTGGGTWLRSPFVDTHVHFSDLQDPNLYYAWLQPGWKHPILGDIEGIQAQRYWADEFVAETRFSNVKKSIHVQAALGIKDPVEETKWLQAFADRLGHPHGIVAEVHLAQPDAAEVIERHMQYANMRGVRDFGPGDYTRGPDVAPGYAHLRTHDLVACLDSSPETYPRSGRLAESVPQHRHLARSRWASRASVIRSTSRCGSASSSTSRAPRT